MKIKLFYIFALIIQVGHCQFQWESIAIPDTIQIMDIASNNENHIFLASAGNTIEAGIYRSIDNLTSWEYLTGNDLSIYSIEITENNVVFIGCSKNIYRSNNNGDSWEMVFEGSYNVTSIKTATGGLAFANSGSGSYISVVKSTNFGYTWDEVFVIPGMIEYIYDFSILNEDTIYMCTTNWFDGGGVYKTIDGGDNWEFDGMYDFHCTSLAKNSKGDIFVGTYGHNTQYWFSGIYVKYFGEDVCIQLNSTLVNDLLINNQDNIYAATDYGILESSNDGLSFEYVNEGLFEGNIKDLAIDNNGFLFASSHNPCNLARSTKSTITGINMKEQKEHLKCYPNPAKDYLIFETKEHNQLDHSEILIRDIYGNQITTVMLNSNQTVWDTRSIAPGIYFYRTVIDGEVVSGKIIFKK